MEATGDQTTPTARNSDATANRLMAPSLRSRLQLQRAFPDRTVYTPPTMTHTPVTVVPDLTDFRPASLAGVTLVSAALLMTELALTRIFSVTMYYHFAFLAISIALFGLSASGVLVFVLRSRVGGIATSTLLAATAMLHGAATLLALAFLVRIRVGLDYSTENLFLMLAIYGLSALPFLTGGAVVSLSFARLADRINMLYAADLLGA